MAEKATNTRPIKMYDTYTADLPETTINETEILFRNRMMMLTPGGLFSKLVDSYSTHLLINEWEILKHFESVGLADLGVTPVPYLLKNLATNPYVPNPWKVSSPAIESQAFNNGAAMLSSRIEGRSMENWREDEDGKTELFPIFNQVIRGIVWSLDKIHEANVLLPDLHGGNVIISTTLRTSTAAQVAFVDFELAVTKEEFEQNADLRQTVINVFDKSGNLPEGGNREWEDLLKAQKIGLIREIVDLFIAPSHIETHNQAQYNPTSFYFELPEKINWEYYDPYHQYGLQSTGTLLKQNVRRKVEAEKNGYAPNSLTHEGLMKNIFKGITKKQRLAIAHQLSEYSEAIRRVANSELFLTGSDGTYGNVDAGNYMRRRWMRIMGTPILNVILPNLLQNLCGVAMDRDVKNFLSHATHPQNLYPTNSRLNF